MAIATNREHLDNGSPGGCRVRGLARQVIDGGGVARTLTVGESGALCVWNTAAGQAYTLPAIGADDVGVEFQFVVTLLGTGTYSVATDASTTFMGGGVIASDAGVTTGGDGFPADIAATVAFTADSDLTGRFAGTQVTLTALSSTTWAISGVIMGTGSMATPF